MPIAVSPEWKHAIQGQFRLPAYLRADIFVVPPGLREGATATAGTHEAFAGPEQTIDGVASIQEEIATLEPGRWPGDGSAYLASSDSRENLETGCWSSDAESPKLRLVFTFDEAYDIPGVNIIWDRHKKAWPKQLKLTGYSTGGVTVAQYSFDSLKAPQEFLSAPFTAVGQVVMDIQGWSQPNQRIRVTEVTFGLAMSFNNDRISNAHLGATADPLSGELPRLGISFDLTNYDREFDPTLKTGYAKYLAQRQLVNLQWGFETSHKHVEWMKPWPLYLSSWDIPADSQTVTLATTSRLSFLDQVYSRGTYDPNPRTLLSMAEEVLRNSGIIKNTTEEVPWELDPVLSTLYSRAPLPMNAYNALLQLISNAAGCTLDNNPENNYVRIRKGGMPADYDISTAQQLGDPSFKIIDRLKSVSVGMRTFSRRTTREQVYSFQGVVSGRSVLEVVYDQEAIVDSPQVAITGATIATKSMYARGARITVDAPAGGINVSIQITGHIVDESTTWVQTYNDAGVTSGLEVTVDNPLVTEMATVMVLAKAVQNMYLRQVEATVPYTGYPELETGDTVKFSTNYGWLKGDISEVSLDFNGGFTGSVTAKMLNVGALDRADKSAWYSAEIACGEV